VKDENGTTAVEFGLVAVPFFMLLFGIISVGFYFFTMFTLENAVEDAARLIRTGQVQTANMSAADFKTQVCSHLPDYVDCPNKVRINVQTFTSFGSITTPSCLDGAGALITNAATTYSPGASSNVVLVTACYEWALAGQIPFLKLGQMSNGSHPGLHHVHDRTVLSGRYPDHARERPR
jgi:Flp pilus assembly protein TadG